MKEYEEWIDKISDEAAEVAVDQMQVVQVPATYSLGDNYPTVYDTAVLWQQAFFEYMRTSIDTPTLEATADFANGAVKAFVTSIKAIKDATF